MFRITNATLGHLLVLLVLSGLAVFVLAAQDKQAPRAADDSAAVSAGAAQYAQHCALCHGNDLTGSGPFPPPYRKPPDLTTLAKRHGGKFPEAYIASVLRSGPTIPAHRPLEMPILATTHVNQAQFDAWIRDLTAFIKSRQAK